MTTSLPNFIPPQTVEPIIQIDDKFYWDINWYLFFYNLTINVLSQKNGVPVSQSDLLDMVDLDANLSGLKIQDSPQNISLLLQNENQDDANSSDYSPAFFTEDATDQIKILAQNISNLAQQSQTDYDVYATVKQMNNAILLALESELQDPEKPAGPVIPLSPTTSPFTYVALHDGTLAISGTASTSINIIRYGVTVPTGMTDGTIPMRKNDTVNVSWSGSTAPIMNYLPNK